MGLPQVTCAYTVRDEATGEYYTGSTINLQYRWKDHRKKRTKAHKLLERPTAYIEWTPCSLDVARQLERAIHSEGGAELSINVQKPSGKRHGVQVHGSLAEHNEARYKRKREQHKRWKQRQKEK